MKKLICVLTLTMLVSGCACVPTRPFSPPSDWKTLADLIIADYRGDIIFIEQLNSSTCWAVLSPKTSSERAVEIAENIGYYIRTVLGKTPTVRVFVNGVHVAIARSSQGRYVGKLKIESWGTSTFKGEHRPKKTDKIK